MTADTNRLLSTCARARSGSQWAFSMVGVLVLVFILLYTPAEGQSNQAVFDRIDERVASQLKTTDTPGAALVIIENEEVVHTQTWGVDGFGEPMTIETPFLWGSVAKPVAALAVMQLVEVGVIDLDASVTIYLDYFQPTWQGGVTTVTVAQLLNHTSSISERTSVAVTDRHDNAPDAVSRVAAGLSDVELASEPGTSYSYASANYLLLGAIVEAVSGQRYGEYVHEHVLEPLGMNGAITNATEASLRRLPPGHRQIFGRSVEFSDPYDTSGAPYGYLGGSVTDLTRFALAQLGRGQLEGTRVLSEENVAVTHTPQASTGGGHYGYGWSIGTLGGTEERIVWHSGATPGYQAALIMLPESRSAVILLQNTFSIPRDAQLLHTAFDVAHMARGYAPTEPPVPDQMMLAFPWIAASLSLLLLVGSVWPRSRRTGLARKPASIRPGWLVSVGLIVGITLSVAIPIGLPQVANASWRVMWLWTPDIAYTSACAAVVAAFLAIRCVVDIIIRFIKSAPLKLTERS